MDRKPRVFTNKEIAEEMEQFREEYRKEARRKNDFIEASRLYNTGYVLNYLTMTGRIESNGRGFRPKK